MSKFWHDLSLRFVKTMNVVLITLPFVSCWMGYYAQRIYDPFYHWGNWAVIGLFVLVYIVFARVYDAFLISVNRVLEMVFSQSLALMLTDGILYVVIWLLSRRLPNILPGLAALGVQLLFVLIWSAGAHKWYYIAFPPRKSAIVYDRRHGMEKLIQKYGLKKKFQIQLKIEAKTCLQDLSVLDSFNTVFINGVHSHERNAILKHCVEKDIQVYVLPRIGDILMSGAKKTHMFHLPILRVGRSAPRPEQLLLKRIFDVVVSTVVLLLASPIMLVTAIAIKATDGGPVFYKQTRLTMNGKEFDVLKFRSMRTDAEKDGVARLSTGSKDDRITPVGRFIRKVRIDELPQLLNVLSGSMSLVGPRPERPEIAQQYERELPEFRLRLQVKAGLTGYAQVYGKYNTTPYDKLQMDLMYIAGFSFIEDLRIVFATIKILFIPESTDGVEEGKTTAAEMENEERELQEV